MDFKFEHWGQRLLYAQLVLYNVWLFAFTIFTIIFQVPNPRTKRDLPDHPQTSRESSCPS